MKLIRNDISFNVDSGKRYYLTIKFGEGQDGSSSFKDIEGNYHTGNLVNTQVGTGAKMEGKFILIGSIVTDTNQHTNATSITYLINNIEVATYREEVAEDNGTIFYSTQIYFT
ncbi:hypothetical protein [Ulvibacter litoralis]|uniref:Uncharacterized protein n=1 Tax=Ulvibacter litoralis TaxID=227084 RepID=A0A1G7D431_9FLAO|nr:hypothetical protein [Ulvibacter litoralis]GHC44916.1 hypothetical protein GCM10008083_04450 [Ulvibacter litoralis]SDE46338.1 hypothetical protein SAMN05421855_101760 [Ulvibacter litoralis]